MNSLFCLSQHHNKYVLHCQNQFGLILQNIHSTMLLHDRFIFEKFLYALSVFPLSIRAPIFGVSGARNMRQ